MLSMIRLRKVNGPSVEGFHSTHTGHPLGALAFVREMERTLRRTRTPRTGA
jgi:hypothetical protein